MRRTSTCSGSGKGWPSNWLTDGFSLSKRAGSFVQEGPAASKAFAKPRRTSASARSSTARAESLKSSLPGSTTAKYKLGLRNCNKELLSTITGGSSAPPASLACRSAALRSGRPSARNPCLVLVSSRVRLRFPIDRADMLIRRTIAILAILGANAVAILSDLSRDPVGPRKRGDHIAHQLRLANAARVPTNDDQAPLLH